MSMSMLFSFVLGSLLSGSTFAAETVIPRPLSIEPSEFFEGDDGWWNSFEVEVGTPGQRVRVLPGTSSSAGNAIWAIIPEGCFEANPGLFNCSSARGSTFARNESSTWSTQRLDNGGLYGLNTIEESYLGLDGSAYYGFDSIVLTGQNGSSLPALDNQLIAGIATNNYWLGSLGLSPLSFNFTNLNDPVESLLWTLRNQSLIPSTSWAYTAGAYYQNPPAYGSLTLGGYDAARFDSSRTLQNVPFYADVSRDLVVVLQSITYDTLGSSPLLTDSIYIFIDSMVSQIWLPINVCQTFEQAFNLTWNSTLQLYLVDDDLHQALLQQNPSFNFTLGLNSSTGDSVDITLPYAAFDLNVTQPLVSESPARYFPLQRAQNSSQYTLGRVFLQEAYVVADYDRHNFSVSQALFPPNALKPQLVPILPPDLRVAASDGRTLSGRAIAGIAVGTVILVASFVGILLWAHRQHRRQSKTGMVNASDLDTVAHFHGSKGKAPLLELDEQTARHELDEISRHELGQEAACKAELAGDGPKLKSSPKRETKFREAQELSTGHVAAAEMEASVTRSRKP